MTSPICGLLLISLVLNGTVARFRDVSAEKLPLTSLTNNSMDIEQGDLDGDGDIDLVIAMEFRPNVLLFNDGHGHFTDASASRLPEKKHDSEDIALADFDRDGDLDIIFVSEDDMINEYYLNNGKGYFTDVSDRLPVEATSNAVVAADLDGDGDLDLVLGNEGQDVFLANDGKGNFRDETGQRLPVDKTVTQDIEAADLDGDGDLDLVLGNEDGNKLYLNIGKGVFTDDAAERLPVTGTAEETRKVDLADIDGDGDLDLFFSNVRFRPGKNPANRLLVNNGKGFFTDESAVRLKGDNSLHSADAQFADLNGDKSLDLIVVNVFGGYPQAFINDGKGSFIEQTTSYFPSRLSGEVISLELMDANRDGVSDLYFGVFRGADFLLYGER
jgi:hypothetical protein